MAEKTMRIDWDFFRKNVDLEEVLHLLNIKTDRTGTFYCPSHADVNHPSAKIRPSRNTWKCFTCGAGSTCLDLVAAVNGTNIREAALFLNEYFPGGIEEVETKENKTPVIPIDLLSKIGLSYNPFTKKKIRTFAGYDQDGKPKYNEATTFQEEDVRWEMCAAELILAKCAEYQQKMKNYRDHMFKFFPGLDQNARDYILERTEEEIISVRMLQETLLDYICELDKPYDFANEREETEPEL